MSKVKIQTEGTPNPNALKFVLDASVLEYGSYDFPNEEKAKDSPLASNLFMFSEVKEVFIGKNFITITKKDDVGWNSIYDKIVQTITSFLDSDKPILFKEIKTIKQETYTDPIEEKIHNILDNQIRPAVNSDGGDVIFDNYKDGILRLHLQGACSSCPSSIMTLKAGIEAMLKREIPELKEVISI